MHPSPYPGPNTELSEFFVCPHRVPGRELSELLSAYYLWATANSPSLAQNSPSSLFRNTTLEAVCRPFPTCCLKVHTATFLLVAHSNAICDSFAAISPIARHTAAGRIDLRYPPSPYVRPCMLQSAETCLAIGPARGCSAILAISEKHRCDRYSYSLWRDRGPQCCVTQTFLIFSLPIQKHNTQKGNKTDGDGFQNRQLWGLSKLAILVHQQFLYPFIGPPKRVSKPMVSKSQVLEIFKTRNFDAPAILVPVWVFPIQAQSHAFFHNETLQASPRDLSCGIINDHLTNYYYVPDPNLRHFLFVWQERAQTRATQMTHAPSSSHFVCCVKIKDHRVIGASFCLSHRKTYPSFR